MTPELALFLQSHVPAARETVVWSEVRLTLESTAYLGSELPPLDYVTSVRSLVLRDDHVLVVRDPNGLHILPGGRRQEDEGIEETLQREVLEETGWEIRNVVLLGFMHFHHLSPRPAEDRSPYPDFLQVIYLAEADRLLPEAREIGGWEMEADFRLASEVEALNLSARDRVYLEAALRSRPAARSGESDR